jgi:hypothetical protein
MGTAESSISVEDAKLARCMAVLVAKRKRQLFAAFPHVGYEDVIAVGEMAALRVIPRFDPLRAQLSTLIYRAASFAVIDLWRKQVREHRRQLKCWRPAEIDAVQLSNLESDDFDESRSIEDLADWCQQQYRAATHAYGKEYIRVGRRHYKPGTAAALMLLMARWELSDEAARELLRDAHEVRRALHILSLPSLDWFKDLRRVLTERTSNNRRRPRQTAGAAA